MHAASDRLARATERDCWYKLLMPAAHTASPVAFWIPLLWIAPLSIYLLTFILCFEGRGSIGAPVIGSILARPIAECPALPLRFPIEQDGEHRSQESRR